MEPENAPAVSDSEINEIFESAARALGTEEKICARFYPYAGIKSNIRRKNGRTEAKVSDGMKRFGRSAMEGLAILLCAKIFRKGHMLGKFEAPISAYRNEISSEGAFIANDELRKLRGRKKSGVSAGNVFNLNEILERTMQKYPHIFSGIEKPQISWSRRRSRRRLAFYDSAFNAITVSRTFDRKETPEVLVEYLVFHELLHAAKKTIHGSGRRKIHHKEFKNTEREFEGFQDAMRYIKQI